MSQLSNSSSSHDSRKRGLESSHGPSARRDRHGDAAAAPEADFDVLADFLPKEVSATRGGPGERVAPAGLRYTGPVVEMHTIDGVNSTKSYAFLARVLWKSEPEYGSTAHFSVRLMGPAGQSDVRVGKFWAEAVGHWYDKVEERRVYLFSNVRAKEKVWRGVTTVEFAVRKTSGIELVAGEDHGIPMPVFHHVDLDRLSDVGPGDHITITGYVVAISDVRELAEGRLLLEITLRDHAAVCRAKVWNRVAALCPPLSRGSLVQLEDVKVDTDGDQVFSTATTRVTVAPQSAQADKVRAWYEGLKSAKAAAVAKKDDKVEDKVEDGEDQVEDGEVDPAEASL